MPAPLATVEDVLRAFPGVRVEVLHDEFGAGAHTPRDNYDRDNPPPVSFPCRDRECNGAGVSILAILRRLVGERVDALEHGTTTDRRIDETLNPSCDGMVTRNGSEVGPCGESFTVRVSGALP